MSVDRPRPVPDRDSLPWWEALSRHELVLQRCADCPAWRWPARALCGRCGSFDWSWEPPSGRGTIASWIVNHHAFSAAFASPYAVVTVRLEDQGDLLLVGSYAGALESLAIDRPVEATFDDLPALLAQPGSEAPNPSPGTLLSWRPVAGT